MGKETLPPHTNRPLLLIPSTCLHPTPFSHCHYYLQLCLIPSHPIPSSHLSLYRSFFLSSPHALLTHTLCVTTVVKKMISQQAGRGRGEEKEWRKRGRVSSVHSRYSRRSSFLYGLPRAPWTDGGVEEKRKRPIEKREERNCTPDCQSV